VTRSTRKHPGGSGSSSGGGSISGGDAGKRTRTSAYSARGPFEKAPADRWLTPKPAVLHFEAEVEGAQVSQVATLHNPHKEAVAIGGIVQEAVHHDRRAPRR
jgi:hypothetical protein